MALPRYLSMLRMTLAAGLLLSTGCGSNDAVSPQPTGPASALISPAGGTLTEAAEDGTRLTLEVPPGAVLEDTRFELVPLEPQPGQLARFSVSPASFLVRPVTLTLELPDGSVFRGKASTGELVAADLDCEGPAQSLSNKIAAAQAGGAVDEELFKQIANEFGTLATDCSELAPSVQQLEATLQQPACAEYASAVADLEDGPAPRTAQAIQTKVDRVVAAQGLKLQATRIAEVPRTSSTPSSPSSRPMCRASRTSWATPST